MRPLENQQGGSACLDVGALWVRARKMSGDDNLLSGFVLQQEESICRTQTIFSVGEHPRPPMLFNDASSLVEAHRILGLNVHRTSLAIASQRQRQSRVFAARAVP